MRYKVILSKDEDGIFIAECPALPGCVSQGGTKAEAIANIKDAAKGYVASLKRHNESIPSDEVVEIDV